MFVPWEDFCLSQIDVPWNNEQGVTHLITDELLDLGIDIKKLIIFKDHFAMWSFSLDKAIG